MRTEIIQDIKRLKGLNEIWDQLLDDYQWRNPFLSFPWNISWWETYGECRRLFVIIIYSDTKPIGIFPLMISKTMLGILPVRKVEFIGAGKSDYMGPIIVETPDLCWSNAMDVIFDHRKLWDVIEFGRIKGESLSSQGIQKFFTTKNSYKNIIHCENQQGNPSILIKESWDDYYKQHISGVKRRKAKRYTRLLEKEGEVVFSESNGNKSLNHLLDEIIKLESNAWKGNTGKGIFVNDRDREFIFKISSQFANLGWLSVHTLRVSNKLIAFIYSFKYNNRYYAYATSYDPEYRLTAPGSLLFKHSIQNCFTNSFLEYDFLQGGEKYKLIWANKFKEIYRLLFFHSGWFSLFLYLQEKYIRSSIKAFKKKIIELLNYIGYEITYGKGRRHLTKKAG